MPVTPKGVIMAVVVILGLVALGGLGGIIWLASTQTPIPSALEVSAATALGAVAGVLASTRTNPDPVVPPVDAPVVVPPVEPPTSPFPGDEPVA